MVDYAAWIALAATCVAALMTAANLGSRVTGWGFVIFTVGAIAWVIVGVATGQRQLLYSNIFLGIVDGIGVWRWLGQRARIDDTTRAEEDRSERRGGENLFSVSRLDGLPVKTGQDKVVAYAVDALAACRGGYVDYLVIRTGGVAGVGDKLHRLPWKDAIVANREIRTRLDQAAIARLPEAAD